MSGSVGLIFSREVESIRLVSSGYVNPDQGRYAGAYQSVLPNKFLLWYYIDRFSNAAVYLLLSFEKTTEY